MSEVQREIEAARVCQRLAPFEPPFRNLAELIARRSSEAAQREYLCFLTTMPAWNVAGATPRSATRSPERLDSCSTTELGR